MKKSSFLYFVLSLVILLNISFSQPVNSKIKLSQPSVITMGDWLAYNLSEHIRMRMDLNAPTRVQYDRQDSTIVVSVYGARSQVENAKVSLNSFIDAIRDFNVIEAEMKYGIVLDDNNYTVIYYNREAKGGPKEIIRMEKGKFQIPQE